MGSIVRNAYFLSAKFDESTIPAETDVAASHTINSVFQVIVFLENGQFCISDEPEVKTDIILPVDRVDRGTRPRLKLDRARFKVLDPTKTTKVGVDYIINRRSDFRRVNSENNYTFYEKDLRAGSELKLEFTNYEEIGFTAEFLLVEPSDDACEPVILPSPKPTLYDSASRTLGFIANSIRYGANAAANCGIQ